jgi:RNAse (barnase) inhibitor barstar
MPHLPGNLQKAHEMRTTIIAIPADQITDWESFHSVFQAAFGFPDFYGRNMNAWIDCMSYLDEPPSGMTNVCEVTQESMRGLAEDVKRQGRAQLAGEHHPAG